MPSCVQEDKVGVGVKVLPRLALRWSYLSLAMLRADVKALEGHWLETQDAGLKAIWEPAVQTLCGLAEEAATEKPRPESDWNSGFQVS